MIPVGTVHAGIIEPGHFRFTANGETVVRLEERLGYVHKGVDSLLVDADLPRGESLKDVLARVMPYWNDTILPDLKAGKRVLIVAHGNSLRALLKHLEGIGDDAITEVDLPTGIPKAYRLNADFLSADAKFLGDPEVLARRIGAVKAQTQRG